MLWATKRDPVNDFKPAGQRRAKKKSQTSEEVWLVILGQAPRRLDLA
jgi:hypothetical protein